MFIKVTLECKIPQDHIPDDLVEQIEVDKEWRPCLLKVEDINLAYPDHEKTGTLIDTEEGFFLIKESLEELEIKINEAKAEEQISQSQLNIS